MSQIRQRLTYANVVSSLALFLVLGGATAFAATQLPKNSVGTKQLKKNAVSTAKLRKGSVNAARLKKNAVGPVKLKGGAVTTAKIRDGAVTGAKIDLATLGTVPSAASTEEVQGSSGTLAVGGQATMFEYGPLKLIATCQPYELTRINATAYIESSTDGTTFASSKDQSSSIGPGTPPAARELLDETWANSNGPFESDVETGVAARAASGASFFGSIGMAAEKDSGTCWYWFSGTITG